jgi:hypothetical protein
MDWLEGRLAKEEAMTVADAVQAEKSNQATVTWLQSFLDLGKSTVLREPPAELSRAVTANFRAFAQGQQQSTWLQRMAATLTSDSWQRPSLVGVRHTGLEAAPRQLVYQTNAADVAVNIQAGTHQNVFDLFGQVFPRDGSDPDSFAVQLIHQEREVALTYANNVGKFGFTELAAGIYSIIIRGDQVEITVAPVELDS